nr:MAG TPA: hypothetical protein [Bacteriophage sp.]
MPIKENHCLSANNSVVQIFYALNMLFSFYQ